jgi:hypothetical protein
MTARISSVAVTRSLLKRAWSDDYQKHGRNLAAIALTIALVATAVSHHERLRNHDSRLSSLERSASIPDRVDSLERQVLGSASIPNRVQSLERPVSGLASIANRVDSMERQVSALTLSASALQDDLAALIERLGHAAPALVDRSRNTASEDDLRLLRAHIEAAETLLRAQQEQIAETGGEIARLRAAGYGQQR